MIEAILRRALLLSVPMLGVLLAPVCWAGSREEVSAAIGKFMSARSYHASMTATGPNPMNSELDFVAPDRYRMRMTGVGEQTVIGNTMHMTLQGRTMRLPIPKGTLSQWRDPARLSENARSMTVTALGSEASAAPRRRSTASTTPCRSRAR